MMKIKNSMKKGVSLMEVMTVTAIMGVIGGMSFVHVQNMKVNEIMQEAKIQLSHIYQAQLSYRTTHNHFVNNGDLSEIAFLTESYATM